MKSFMANQDKTDPDKFPHHAIGARLKALRKTTGMRAKEYTDLLDIKYTRYINWESGHRRLLPDEAEVFCEKFGVTLDFIYRGIEAQLPHSLMIALSSKPLDKDTNTSSDTDD